MHVARLAIEDWLMDRAHQSCHYMSSLSHGPYLSPIRKLCNGACGPDWNIQHQASLRAIAANGIWDQARKYKH
eukprot:1625783-Pyramimonas_sp.AAC.1